jgi:predicted Zn finger-like uncharacterized protein
MKFVCDQCKAKYQISDDKVAGKTVRMKCRKCGHLIEVRAAVTETSVATTMPPKEGAEPSGAHAPPDKPAVPRLATSLAATRPSPPKGPQTGSPKAETTGALAGAFQKSVQQPREDAGALDMLELSASDEWYVAINGVPVGPIRMTELRRKASIGAVTEDSLVWQEGFEEWRPVRAFPELAALVREAAATARPSLLPGGDVRDGGRSSALPPAPLPRPASNRPPPAPAAGAAVGKPLAPRPVTGPAVAPPLASSGAAAARTNVIPFQARAATAERLDDVPRPVDAMLEPARAAQGEPLLAPVADPFAPTVASPIAPPAAASGATSIAASHAPTPFAASAAEAPPASRDAGRRPIPWIPIAMCVMALSFGITAAVVVFKPQPPPNVVVTPPAPATVVATVPATTAAPAEPAPIELGEADLPNVAAPARPAAKGPTASAPKAAAGGAQGGNAPDPALADLLKGSGAGPSAGPGRGAAGGGGSSLTEDQISGVVAQHKLAVRRACWERIESTTPNVKVTAKVVIGGGGQVQSATATGNDPIIARCIENNIKGWRFPATGGSTTVDIPFTFLRQ